jgi:hypothetical protein
VDDHADICGRYGAVDAWQKPAMCRTADDDFMIRGLPAILLLGLFVVVWVVGRAMRWF